PSLPITANAQTDVVEPIVVSARRPRSAKLTPLLDPAVTAANSTGTTGSKSEIYELARSVFQADVTVRGSKDAADFLHTESVYLLDTGLYLRGIYRTRGLPDLERLNRELGQLRTEGT
ncbi:MAG TPA: hypothetical protein PKY99_02300, partial [Turneriella sp.]|nr:hypothetical protein [Turneriella sp.]